METPPAPVTLFLATRNAHKAGEIRAVLGEGLRHLTLNDFADAPNVVEDAASFAGNAAKKASELAHWLASTDLSRFTFHLSRAFILADDSGLEVDALNGAPGVHSARFAALDAATAGNSPDQDNNAKLLRLLKDVPAERRTARFRCVIALARISDQSSGGATPELFEGSCEGRIGFAPRGQGGFGYDPLFVPVGFEQTFAELGPAAKNQLSHRARALKKLQLRLNLPSV